jgi:hypothetical protein
MTTAQTNDSALFARYYDLMIWLTQRVASFPRAQRFLLAQQLLVTGYGGYAQLIEARKVVGAARSQALLNADVSLELLRMEWRMALDLVCINMAQYEHGAGLINEVGRLLGAWRKGA